MVKSLIAGGFVGYGFKSDFNNNSVQIGENLKIDNSSQESYVGGFAGTATFVPENAFGENTVLIFGDLDGGSAGQVLLGGLTGYVSGTPDTLGKLAVYIEGQLSAKSTDLDSAVSAYTFAAMDNSHLKDVTVLKDVPDGKEQIDSIEDYLGVMMGDSSLTNVYLVEVKDWMRTARQVDVAEDGTVEIRPGQVGVLEIDPRLFQDDYWGPNAAFSSQSYPNTKYVQNNEGLSLAPYSKDYAVFLNNGDGSVILIPDYYTRHLAVSDAGNQVTYDILGIKAGFVVSYEFVPEKKGDTLPSSVMALIPKSAKASAGEMVTAAAPAEIRVKVPGGVWEFQGYDKESVVVKDENVTFTGTWAFKADPEKPDDSITPAEPTKPSPPSGTDKEVPSSAGGTKTSPKTGDEGSVLFYGLLLLGAVAMLSTMRRQHK